MHATDQYKFQINTKVLTSNSFICGLNEKETATCIVQCKCLVYPSKWTFLNTLLVKSKVLVQLRENASKIENPCIYNTKIYIHKETRQSVANISPPIPTLLYFVYISRGIWPCIMDRPGSSDLILITENVWNCLLGLSYHKVTLCTDGFSSKGIRLINIIWRPRLHSWLGRIFICFLNRIDFN